MSGYGRNLRHSDDLHRFNQAQQRPCDPMQIACRVCGQIFMSTQALINHVDCHLIEDKSTPLRRQHERNQMSYQREINPFVNLPFQPSLPLPMTPLDTPPFLQNNYSPVHRPAAERNPNFNTTQLHVLPSTPPPNVLRPSARSNYTLGPWPIPSVQQDKRRVMEESPSDYTKPYLNQLDHPIPEIVEVAEIDDENYLNKLDLTLKL